MAREILVTIERMQTCQVSVRVEDSVNDLSVYRMDALEMIKGLMGIDWESDDYRVYDVAAQVDDPDSYPRLNLAG
jgi:hypothetical protein